MAAELAKSVGLGAFPLNPMYSTGKKMLKVNAKFVVPTSGDAGDMYVLAGPMSLDTRVSRILGNGHPALTTATDNDLGFYYSTDNLATLAGLKEVKTGSGAALWDGVTMATAVTVYTDLLTAKNSSLDNTKSIRDLLSLGPDQAPQGGIYLCLKIKTANTAGGTCDWDIELEEATTR